MAPRHQEETFTDDENIPSTEGLAKGVFAFPRKRKAAGKPSPSKLKKAKRGRKGAASPARSTAPTGSKTHTDLLFDEFSSKEDQWARERVEVHTNLLQVVEEKVDTIQDTIFQGVYDSLVNFVSNSQKMRENSVRAIPTAVLLTGVNMPDHNKILTTLVKRLKAITPHISVLQSGQNTKQLITNIVLDLVYQADEEDDEVTMVKKCDASFGYLEEWYSNQYPSDSRKPLVLLAQDFENFSGSSLSDLITLCRRYEGSLPIVLILGVATTVTTVHKTLPQSITAHLTINTFGSPNSTRHLEEVIDAIVIDPEVPFKLSEKVLRWMVENFLYHDFSVSHFLSAYRFILGEHLYRQPGSMLLVSEKEAENKISKMNMVDLTYICRVPSFRAYIETLVLRDQAETLTNENVCRETVTVLVKEYFEHVRTFTAMVKVLFCLTKDLPRKPMGKLLRDVYERGLTGGIYNTREYREAFQFLKLSNRVDLENKLKAIQNEIVGIRSLDEFGKSITTSLDRIEEIKNIPENMQDSPMITDRMNSSQNNSMLSSSMNTSGVTPILSRGTESPAGSSPGKAGTPEASTTTRSSPLKSRTPTDRQTRNSPMKGAETETPVDRMSRSRNSPMKQSTPVESPADISANPGSVGEGSVGVTPLLSASGSVGVTPLLSASGSVGVTPLGSGANSPYTGRPLGRLDRLKLHAGLLDAAHRNSIQHQRPFDGVRSSIINILHINLKKYLEPPTTRPLHEIFTFKRNDVLKTRLTGAPRAALHTALTDPFFYLHHPDLKIADIGEIPASLPDLSIAYKLHLECPRLINIYDWLSCWNSIVTQGEQQITKVGQAKFTRSVSELQHLGFIKTSNRKADHVGRLTFGGS